MKLFIAQHWLSLTYIFKQLTCLSFIVRDKCSCLSITPFFLETGKTVFKLGTGLEPALKLPLWKRGKCGELDSESGYTLKLVKQKQTKNKSKNLNNNNNSKSLAQLKISSRWLYCFSSCCTMLGDTDCLLLQRVVEKMIIYVIHQAKFKGTVHLKIII